MEKNPNLYLTEVIFSSSDKKISAQISRLVKQGKIRKIAPRVYSSNFTDSSDEIIKRNLFTIIGNLYPKAVLSHRSAFEFKPTSAGHIFLTYSYTKSIPLAGITLRFLQGQEPIEGDTPFSGQLYVSQQARAFLENLQQSKMPGPTSKTLSLPVIEEKLEQIIRVHGEEELNKLRDNARKIAKKLSFDKEFGTLETLISALLNTHEKNILTSPVAVARAFGLPYDPIRLKLFEELFITLQNQEFKSRPEKNNSQKAFKNFAFFESYFSNYIEGTVFEIDEAKQIITSNQPLPSRNQDSHDILGTYYLVSNKQEMSKTPKSAEELLSILRFRHQMLLSARTDKNPGYFKTKNNFAGQTAFVDFNLVQGTLIKAFDFYKVLKVPFARAAYMKFIVSEVHPFLDGNGRLARVMMNAELVSAKQSKIIIPTVFRDDYVGVLRKVSRHQEITPYIKMLQKAFEFSSTIYDENLDAMQQFLEKCNAFMEHSEANLKIIKKETP
jgi:hypothetical protein